MRSLIFILLTSLLPAQTREEALELAHQAGEKFESDPSAAAVLARNAYATLAATKNPAAEDLAACAGLSARASRLAGEIAPADKWFRIALTYSTGEDAVVIRAELGDMLMRAGDIRKARRALGPPPTLPLPSPEIAQWFQTLAKLDLACGLPEKASLAIQSAIKALPADDPANRVALLIDQAGITLRLNQPIDELLEKAYTELRKLDQANPALSSALISIAAQDPDLDPNEALTLLQGVDLESLPEGVRLSFSVSLAEAAAKTSRPELANSALEFVLKSDALPDDHPLLARALLLAANARNDAALAKKSSEVAMRWLTQSEPDDSEILLGIQRTVDPISPLVNHAQDSLPEIALASQNHALRQRLNGTISSPKSQTILYLIYQKEFAQHYGALVFKPEPVFVDLGKADRIHQRIVETLDTAERTLAEEPKGATMQVRLTQLYKSVWEPLAEHLDHARPINIAPTGMLHAVPWATLRQRDGRYLCQIADKVNVLALLGNFPETLPSSTLLACGVSEAPTKIKGGEQFPFDDRFATLISSLPSLPGVSKELSAIDNNSLLNPTKEALLAAFSKKPGALHLAGHGFVLESEEGHGFRAGFVLGGGGRENILFAHEIARLDLSQTNLVVLSACRGGIGQNEVGGNWSSLRRAFIAAGVRHVLAAQWRVRDDELPEFMSRFHEKRKTASPPQALWQLQREWLEDEAKGDEAMRAASAGAWLIESVGGD